MHSSTLRPCSVGLATSSGLLMSSRLPRSSTLQPLARAPVGRNSLKLINPRSCHAHNGGVVVRARKEMDYEFREEKEIIDNCFEKINASVSCSKATEFRGYLCSMAKTSVRLASIIMAKPGDISSDTLLSKLMTPTRTQIMALQGLVSTFVSTAEDAYNDKVTKETTVSFVRAIEILGAISYFMAQDTLANVGGYEVNSLDSGRDFNVDADRSEYMEKMATLRHDLKAQSPDADWALMRTVCDAMILTEPFVISMRNYRIKALRGLMPAVGGATAV